MRLYVVLCGLGLALAALASFASPRTITASAVASSEAKRVLGGDCYGMGITTMWICYGSNCQSGGCGCSTMHVFTATPSGGHLDPAIKCDASKYCTSPQSVSGACTGS